VACFRGAADAEDAPRLERCPSESGGECDRGVVVGEPNSEFGADDFGDNGVSSLQGHRAEAEGLFLLHGSPSARREPLSRQALFARRGWEAARSLPALLCNGVLATGVPRVCTAVTCDFNERESELLLLLEAADARALGLFAEAL